MTGIVYPNGYTVAYNYASGLDDSISRLTSLSDNTGTLESCKYLGLGTVVERGHPQPGVNLTYLQQTGDPNANTDGGDKYTGLDRFGRVIDQYWINAASGTATDRFQYGYDRDGNVLFKANLVDAAFSELYHANGPGNGYDPLNQLTAFARGTLSDTNSDGIPDTVASPSHSQSWATDAVGNFTSVTTDGTPVSRTHNRQNELTAVGAANLGYDANGNTTTDDQGHTLVYDAWNRLVSVKSGTTTLASYQYDALDRRIVESGGGTATDVYFSDQGQALEERVGGQAKAHYVWSPVYVDALVLRDRDADGNPANGLEERLYAQQDANWNVTALVSSAGSVAERYIDDPYGAQTVLTAGWSVQSGSAYGFVYGFQGLRLEAASGTWYARWRDLSPTLMRFLQVDPVRFGAGDVDFYRSEGNHPVKGLDPFGLVSTEDFLPKNKKYFTIDAPSGGVVFTNDFKNENYNDAWGFGKLKGPEGPASAIGKVDVSTWKCPDLAEWIAFALASIHYRLSQAAAFGPEKDHAARVAGEVKFLKNLVKVYHDKQCKEEVPDATEKVKKRIKDEVEIPRRVQKPIPVQQQAPTPTSSEGPDWGRIAATGVLFGAAIIIIIAWPEPAGKVAAGALIVAALGVNAGPAYAGSGSPSSPSQPRTASSPPPGYAPGMGTRPSFPIMSPPIGGSGGYGGGGGYAGGPPPPIIPWPSAPTGMNGMGCPGPRW